VVLDGEVVAFDGGRPSFQALQQRMASRVGRRRGAAATYLVFDLLDGRLLTGLPDPQRPGRLRFAGRVDHGLVPAARRRVREALAPLVVSRSPFTEPPAAPPCLQRPEPATVGARDQGG
jgi:ATP-dependent DNA ligase